jgi:short-subunit dehydrogenase
MDRWIICTGISRGIGAEVAKKFHQQGFKIIHLGRKKLDFEDVFLWWDLLNNLRDNPIGELHKILFGKKIVGFFYCAGVMPMLEINDANTIQKRLFWQSQTEAMRVNYLACAELVEEILPFLFSTGDEEENSSEEKFIPFISHISSLSAVDPFPSLELYGATKAAALSYFAWLSKRFSANTISCLSIHPGTVHTDMVLDIIKKERQDHPLVKAYSQIIQEKNLLSAEESADKIYNFLIYETELKALSHGKLFLADKHQIR